jgi:pyruvate-formate lyase-activating enzyme
MSRTDPEREQVASQPRHWVRIARACNNRCAFCLDSNVQDGSMLSREEVERDLRDGLKRGAKRLILSGGEASIHPDFLHFVRRGRELGYEHVQTITNGRMFAYARFTAAAVAAGLDEVTFSLHGHTADLHDSLTGVSGSFDQSVAGIRRAVDTGRLIVSGDVVINRRNVQHLRDVMDLFVGLGVRELDLLMVVPFGRAAPGPDADMLFDPEAALVALRRGLELARDPGLHIWTNRLAPQLLEGYEGLIQDPHKLHDEVRGRRDILDEMVSGGSLRCQGERCAHCFIQPLCAAMQRAIAALDRGVPGILRVDARDGTRIDAQRALVEGAREVLWVRARDAAQAARAVSGSRAAQLWLELDELRWLRRALRGAGLRQPVRIVAKDRAQVRAALKLRTPEVAVPMQRDTTGLRVAAGPDTRVIAFVPPAYTLGEAIELGADPTATRPGFQPSSWLGVPPCLGGGPGVEYGDPLPLSVVRPDGTLHPDAFVTHFIGRLYRVKSLRCRACVHDATCRGLDVQRVRAAGLGILQPIVG